ncbi:hypothetical protein [Rhodospirillum sp. A1_3_36]|uniref:hypothetical protein n=1 Tax=Rhodospirillum sp. A1_3_36 TaxID=3391666 RepID=UPI0039A5A9BC
MQYTNIVVADEVPFLLSEEGVKDFMRRKKDYSYSLPHQGGGKSADDAEQLSRLVARDDPDLIATIGDLGRVALHPQCSIDVKAVPLGQAWRIVTVSQFEVLLLDP